MKQVYCADCFYIRLPREEIDGFDGKKFYINKFDQAVCSRTKTYNLVSGHPVFTFCSIERESLRPEACGMEGKHYQETEPREEWQRDEPQGVTNWDTGWNGVHSCEEN